MRTHRRTVSQRLTAWRSGQDENANWEIVVNTDGYKKLGAGALTKAVEWSLAHSPEGLTVAEIADHIDAEGDLFSTEDLMLQRKRIRRRIGELVKKGVVKSIGREGAAQRWASITQVERMGCITHGLEENTRRCGLSDSDWNVVRPFLPAGACQPSRQAMTRQFLERVFAELKAEGAPRLTPRQGLRFLSWRRMGVWAQVAGALNGRVHAAEFDAVAERLAFSLAP